MYQEDIVSDEKFNAIYEEIRILLGYEPNTRSMSVRISPRRRDKIIIYIEDEGWVLNRTSATICETARLLGMLQSICNIFMWGQAQLLILQQLLAQEIREGYQRARTHQQLHKLFVDESQKVPANLSY